MYNRAKVIDENFQKFVKERTFPDTVSKFSWEEAGLSKPKIVELFDSQILSRILDLKARELKAQNKCYYTIGSSGHEGNAATAEAFRVSDMAFLHYRSGAFMIQRAKKKPGATPAYNALLSLVAAKLDPIAGGRHKVYGSRPLNVPPQTSTIASHLPKAVGTALSIARAKDLGIPAELSPDSIVICSFGDASTNHASAQTAFNTASMVSYQGMNVPIVFICEDNGLGISVPTPKGWVESNFKKHSHIRYFYGDGRHLPDIFSAAKNAESYVRRFRKPAFLHMKTERLLAHAGSDPEWIYHSIEKIEAAEFNDPLLHTARYLIEQAILSADECLELYQQNKKRVDHIAEQVINLPHLESPEEVRESLTACRKTRSTPALVSEELRSQVFGKEFNKIHTQPQHMAKLINYGLTDLLTRYKNTLVFGEDVAQKGGVYNVTDGLCRKFGKRRVFNSPLDETAILGTAVGMAHNGFLPMPEIQFLAYLHNAEDQLRGEASTLAFFSQGQYVNPMVIRVAGLAYQKGFGGHFHNENSLAVLRDIPGVIIAVPSNGPDAVKMMRSCVREANAKGRVVVFIEPIALYMTKDLHDKNDKAWCFPYPAVQDEIPIGEFGVHGEGKDILIVTYGNGYYYSRQAERELRQKLEIKAQVLDLRWVAPIDWAKLSKVASQFKKILIVDECRKTGSLGEALVAGFVEHLDNLPKIKLLAADDCFIALGPAAATGLPKKKEILAAALSMFEGER